MANIFSLYGTVFIDNEKANKSIDETTSKGESFASKLGGFLSKVGKGALVLGGTLATVATTVGTLAIHSQKNMDQAMNSFMAQTGIAKTESEEWKSALEDIYKGNYGENFEDIANSMALASRELDGFDSSQIKEVTENALALRDTFGVEINESIRASKALMTQFGISAEQAYNLMAQGAQNGLDFSGELVDNINEYSVQFGKLGLSAEDMFNIFQSGADAGAWNLDKIGDAVKEFSIRAIDGSNTTIEGFSKLGLSSEEMAKRFAVGGNTAKKAFYEVVEAIKEIDDPVEQSIIGVDLFGTMWEDLGPDVVTQLASIKDMYDGTNQSMNKIKEVRYDDIGSMLGGLKRNVEMLLLPLGNALMPLIVTIINLILENMPLIEGLLNQVTPIVTQLFSSLLPSVQMIVEMLLPMLATLIEQFLPIFISLLSILLPPIIQIVEMVLPLILNLLEPLLPLLQIILELLQPFIEILLALLLPLTELLNVILPPLIQLIVGIIDILIQPLQAALNLIAFLLSNVFVNAFNNLVPVLNGFKTLLSGLIDFIVGIFTGNWKRAWEGVKNIFKGIVDTFSAIFKAPLNFIIDGINLFIKGLNNLKIPDWVPGVGGKGLNLKTFNKLRIGIDDVPYDNFPAILHKGERVLTASENKEFTKNLDEDPRKNNQIIYNNTVVVENMEVRDDHDIERIAEELYYLFKKKEA